jgi:hypothetical protein
MMILPVIVLLYGVIVILTFHHVEEDAYIYFRFAANLAEGHGYVFNQAGPVVESGTSLIWQLLLVPIYFVDPEMVIGTKLLGVACGVLCLFVTHKLACLYIDDPVLAHIPALWLACSYPFYMWSHLGLETPLFLLLVLMLLYCTVHDSMTHWLPGVAFLVVTCRPEGFMMCAVLLPFLFGQRRIPIGVRHALVFLVLVVSLELFRLLYFHDVVPHSFYHKIKASPGFPWASLSTFAMSSLLVVPVLVAAPFLLRRELRGRKTFALWIAVAVAVIWSALGVEAKYYDRSSVVLIPLISILVVHGLHGLASAGDRRAIVLRYSLVAFAPLMLFFASPKAGDGKPLGNALLHSTREIFSQDYSPAEHFGHLLTPRQHLVHKGNVLHTGDGYIYDDYNVMTGEFVKFNYADGITVVYDQMGKTPWYAGLDKYFIDSFGLVDKPIGYAAFNDKLPRSTLLTVFDRITGPIIRSFGGEDRSGWNHERAIDYIFDREPEVIMVHRFVMRLGPNSIAARMQRDARIAKNYTAKYSVNYALVYERNGLQRKSQEVIFPDNCRCKVLPEGG